MTAAPADGSHRDAVPWRFILPLVVLAAVAVAAYAFWLPAGNHRYEATWSGPSDGEVTEYDGFEHCGTEEIRFLSVRLGTIAGVEINLASAGTTFALNAEDARQSPPPGAGLADLDAELPANAIDTGYHHRGRRLYIVPGYRPEAVYIVGNRHVERWPRSDSGCD